MQQCTPENPGTPTDPRQDRGSRQATEGLARRGGLQRTKTGRRREREGIRRESRGLQRVWGKRGGGVLSTYKRDRPGTEGAEQGPGGSRERVPGTPQGLWLVGSLSKNPSPTAGGGRS